MFTTYIRGGSIAEPPLIGGSFAFVPEDVSSLSLDAPVNCGVGGVG
jgi:hypothetical protein